VVTFYSVSDNAFALVDDEPEFFKMEYGTGTNPTFTVDVSYGLHTVKIYPDQLDPGEVRLMYATILDHTDSSGGEQIEVTPDGATVYTELDDGSGVMQTVALRYQVDAGQIMIVILLTVMIALLLVMLVAQMRRGAPEP